MRCNIDARGKTLRLISGGVVEGFGLLLIVVSIVGMLPPTWPLWIGGLLVLLGWFLIYEGLSGWCVLRAIGFKTPV